MSTNKKEAYEFLKKMYDNDLDLIRTGHYNNEMLIPQAEALKIALTLFNADKWRKTGKYLPEQRDMNSHGEVIVTCTDTTEAFAVDASLLIDQDGVITYPLWKPFPKPPYVKKKSS